MKSYGRIIWNSALAFSICLGLAPALVRASESNGTISISNSYAWGENFGWINFAPKDNSDNYHGLIITDSAVLGYAWSPTFGWINFAPTHGGVTNSCAGQLGGYAWSEQLGWISLSGISINESGKFTGIGGDNADLSGRISFDCDLCNVSTDWRQCSLRNQNPGGNGGGGGIPATSGSDGGNNTTSSTVITLKNPVLYQPYSPSNNKTYFISGIADPEASIDLFIDGAQIKNWESTDTNGRFDGWADLSVDRDHEIYVIAKDEFGNQSQPSNIRIVKKPSTIKPDDRPPIIDTTSTPPIQTGATEATTTAGNTDAGSGSENTGNTGNSNNHSGDQSSGGGVTETKPGFSLFGAIFEKFKSFFNNGNKNITSTASNSNGQSIQKPGIVGFLSSNPVVTILGGFSIVIVLLVIIRFVLSKILR